MANVRTRVGTVEVVNKGKVNPMLLLLRLLVLSTPL